MTGLSPRPQILKTSPAYHGALDYAELEQLGLNPDEILDFSVNSNPFGPSPRVRQATATTPLDRYPDRESLALRRALADRSGISPEQIVVGNGAAELLWLVSFTFLRPRDRALVVGPTFGEYSRTAALMGAQVHVWNAQPETDFVVRPEAVARRLARLTPRLVFLCNPNNPTGRLLPVDVIAGWARACPCTLFVVDEAYLSFSPHAESVLSIAGDNLLALRSMTKDYALAGLRLGYAASTNRSLVNALARARPAWNVNALAQAAGLAALADDDYLRRCLVDLRAAAHDLKTGLAALGLRLFPSDVHFFLARVGDAAAFRRALLRQNLLVRDAASFGLPDCVRIAARRPEENRRLVETIQTLVDGRGMIGREGEKARGVF